MKPHRARRPRADRPLPVQRERSSRDERADRFARVMADVWQRQDNEDHRKKQPA